MRVPKTWIAPAAGFCLTALMLAAARQASPMPVLLADRLLPGWATHGVRAAILALAVIVPLVLRTYGVTTWIAVTAGLAFGILGVACMLTLSRKFSTMVHCTVICPVGLVADLLGKLSPWRIRIGENCTGCEACVQACRYSALGNRDLANGRPGLTCTLCGDCLDRCPEGAIGYHVLGLGQKTARVCFVCLVVSLHAAFLGLARI